MIFSSPILAISPHIDDVEFGAGGLLTKLISKNIEVHLLTLSNAEISLPLELPRDILVKESQQSVASIGIPESNVTRLNLRTRYFYEKRQEILETLVSLRSRINPCCVLVPNTQDVHQDHSVVTQEAIRAFKQTSILGYELPWNNLSSNLSFYIPMTLDEMVAKERALSFFKSQSGRFYFSGERIRALSVTRGLQIGEQYAEAFETIRIVLRP